MAPQWAAGGSVTSSGSSLQGKLAFNSRKMEMDRPSICCLDDNLFPIKIFFSTSTLDLSLSPLSARKAISHFACLWILTTSPHLPGKCHPLRCKKHAVSAAVPKRREGHSHDSGCFNPCWTDTDSSRPLERQLVGLTSLLQLRGCANIWCFLHAFFEGGGGWQLCWKSVCQ